MTKGEQTGLTAWRWKVLQQADDLGKIFPMLWQKS
jgi:hypothetical protein